MPDTVTQMSRDEFRRWAEGQPRGRFERVDGQVVRMTPERVVHVQLKTAIWLALDAAIRSNNVAGQAYGDGVTVEVGADTDYEPDALVNLGAPPDPDAVTAPRPIIVVEVLSPSTQSIDTGEKLAGYFRVPSIQHYLVVSARRRQVVHHRRLGDATVSTVVTEGEIVLDPPGISISMDAIYRDVRL